MKKIFKLTRGVTLNRGVTLVELLIALGIFAMLAVVIGKFERDIFHFNTVIQSDLGAQIEGRRAIVTMVSEMREMSPSALGAYPIAAAATSSITFFSDIDSDTVKEQIQYYVSGTRILKSVINPTGSPLVYNAGSAVVTTVVSSITNGTSTPLFEYYDTNYAGTSTPLSIPVNISSVKLVKINMLLERKPTPFSSISITSQVTPRNLKDNW